MTTLVRDRVHSFWSGSIQHRMTLTFALATALVMLVFGFSMVHHERDFLFEQSAGNAKGLAHTIAVSSASWVVANDVVGLQEVLQNVARVPNLQYAMVLSPQGRVIAGTDARTVGLFVHDSVSQELLRSTSTQPLILVDNDAIVDAAAPVMVGQRCVGWARIGMGRAEVEENLRDVVRQSAWIAMIAIAITILLAMALSRGLIAGLQQLVEVAVSVHAGRRDVRARVVSQDEVGTLSEEFNVMLDALMRSEQDLERLHQGVKEAEELWRFALEGAGDGVWDWNVQAGEVRFSSRWEEILGYTPGEIMQGRQLEMGARPWHGDQPRPERKGLAHDRYAFRY